MELDSEISCRNGRLPLRREPRSICVGEMTLSVYAVRVLARRAFFVASLVSPFFFVVSICVVSATTEAPVHAKSFPLARLRGPAWCQYGDDAIRIRTSHPGRAGTHLSYCCVAERTAGASHEASAGRLLGEGTNATERRSVPTSLRPFRGPSFLQNAQKPAAHV